MLFFKRVFLLSLFIPAAAFAVYGAVPFEQQSDFAGNNAGGAGAVWADVNDDGWLDVMVHGRSANQSSALFAINRGNDSWTVRQAPYGFVRSFASVGDFDNDNRPDVLLTGAHLSSTAVGTRTTIIYGVASNQLSQLALPSQVQQFPFYFADSHSVVLDLDHDGRQDILVTGNMQADYSNFTNTPDPLVVTGAVSRLLRNEFSGTRGFFQNSYFRLMTTPLPAMGHSGRSDNGHLSSGDLDGDGFPDIYSHGFPDPSPDQNLGWKTLRADGEMGLAVAQAGNRGLGPTTYSASCSVWADLNGDGLDDLVVAEGSSAYLSGSAASGLVQVLLSDGQGHLTNSGPPLVHMGWNALAVGDIFNHGRNDILVFGMETARAPGDLVPPVLIFRNDGNGVFTRLDFGFPSYGYPSIQGQGLSLADYNRDGRLDFCRISTGISGGDDAFGLPGMAVLFRNALDIPSNAPPQSPTNLSTVTGPGTVTFHWGHAADDITPVNLLTYNLRVGTNSLGTSVVSPLANVTNGWRKVAAPGNCRHTFSALYRFPPGTYYWSVQAVDGGFAGGAWAAEQTFTITEPGRPMMNISRSGSQSTLSWPARFPDYALQETPSLTATNWTSVTNALYYDDGKIKAGVGNQTPSTFFRLTKP